MKPDRGLRFLGALVIASTLWPFYTIGSLIFTILTESITIGCVSVVILYIISLVLGWVWFG